MLNYLSNLKFSLCGPQILYKTWKISDLKFDETKLFLGDLLENKLNMI